ncbi:MarR family winged helix-turn-helix transcriptional regulator [Thalassomonas actiniarum]|uniref:MarR family transcriptional regulator n=1 Tax=Thalassomonas actiniarum TaxID=485447 RepID=A0AAE9YI76_9GAMM|nr:MarR family transcriptional regulator [Thalassomonas actiniarum]WDD96785.1 MarR family transcriptional regulator [Thalassomonas actiniarum]
MNDSLQLEKQLCFRLYSVNKAMNRMYAPLLKELGLTYPQYLVMLALWDKPEAVTVKQLGKLLDLDSGTLSPLLKRMEKQELLHRSRSESDERSVQVSLSAHGKHIRAKAKLIPAKMFAKTGLPMDEFLALNNQLDQLLAKISDN